MSEKFLYFMDFFFFKITRILCIIFEHYVLVFGMQNTKALKLYRWATRVNMKRWKQNKNTGDDTVSFHIILGISRRLCSAYFQTQ